MIRQLCALLLLASLSGCSMWRDDPEPQLVLNIHAASNINPNIDGKPSPLELRVFQLTDSAAFEQADFLSIYSDEQGVLKAELVLSRHLPSLLPGETRKEIAPLGNGVKYIGIIAGFANYREAKNQVIYKPVIDDSTVINVEIDGINLSVTGDEENNG